MRQTVTIVVDVVLCLAAIFGLCVLGINAQRNETGLRGWNGLLRAVILSLLAAPLDVAVESVTQVDTPGKVVAHWVFDGRIVLGFGPMLLLWFGLDYLMCLTAVYGLSFVGIWL